MEEQSEVPIKQHTFKKSPQELASQVQSVYGTLLEFTKHPNGEVLDERYKQSRQYVEKLLEAGVSDEQLSEELDRLYQEGRGLGIYAPLEGEKADEFLLKAKEYYLGWGYSDEEAEAEARKKVSNQGYLAELRKWRRNYEGEIRKHFSDFTGAHPLTPQEESEQITRLGRRCFFLSDPESASRLAAEFPGGNYLYHGTKVEQAIEIVSSGVLANAKILYEREEERVSKEGGERRIIKRNSGYEGISWNFNEIGALPGDRYHLVGFLAPPNGVLNEQLQLAIPSRPAPNELILINGNIDADRYYSFKTQQELLITIGLGESNSAWSNIVQLASYKERQAKQEKNMFSNESMLAKFSERDILDEQMTELLKSRYSVRNNETIEFSPKLLRQVEDDIPVGAVWLQALIDTGRIKNVLGFEDVKTVRGAISRVTLDNFRVFLDELRREKLYLEDAVKKEEDKVTSIEVPVSETFLVVPDTDLNKWLRLLARVKVQPKGIVVYSYKTVRLENFASQHHGDNQALTDVLRETIPASEGYIDFEAEILGEEITNDKLVGYRKHVVGEQFLGSRKAVRKGEDGKLFIS